LVLKKVLHIEAELLLRVCSHLEGVLGLVMCIVYGVLDPIGLRHELLSVLHHRNLRGGGGWGHGHDIRHAGHPPRSYISLWHN